MVCSPHQYTLQKIATPYLPAVNYIKQQNYLQTPAYRSIPQKELYRARRTDLQEKPAYQPRQQYAASYQNNERQRDREENIFFTAPLWTSAQLEPPRSIPEPSVSSAWKDYGLPLYSTPRILKEIKQQPPEQKIKRDDLMQRIQQELTAMKARNKEKIVEDYLCAA